VATRTYVRVRDGVAVTLHYARKNPANGTYYDNTKITAVSARVLDPDGTLVQAFSLTYQTDAGGTWKGYTSEWDPVALLDTRDWVLVILEPTRVGVPAANAPPREYEIDLSDLAKRQDELETAVNSRAAPGDAMDLVVDAVDASAVAASAVAEIQAGLATAAAVAGVQADTDDLQTRLPAALNAGRMSSHVEVLDAAVADQIRTEVLTHVLEGNTSGLTTESTLNLLRKILNNRLELADGAVGNWVLYADDDTTVLLTYNVQDKTGGPINQPTLAPSRRTRGA
jgi:hypothetical protein